MARIIVSGASAVSREQIDRLLVRSGFDVFRVCASSGELRRAMNACEDGVVVLAGALPDCRVDDLAADFSSGFRFLLIGRPGTLEACESLSVFRLTYPCGGNTVTGAVEMLIQMHAMSLPRRRDEEKALVEKAKRRLMERRGMSEAQAHRHMQQAAMTRGIRMTDIAVILLRDPEGTDGP
ncbi:MAG: ANTAR domain-containing protein [Clostridia bacterium]|nr:ANTAR domain-containing protein [Clostridia bacterium]